MRRHTVFCCGLAACLSAACHPDAVEPTDRSALWDTYDSSFLSCVNNANGVMGREIVKVSRLAPGTIPRRIEIQGTPYEFGYWMGLVARSRNLRLSPRLEAGAEINRQIEAMYVRVSPQYLDLVRGVCAAFGTALEQVDLRPLEREFFNNMWWDLFQYPLFSQVAFGGAADPWRSCSALWARVGPEGIPWLAHNFDHSYDRPHFIVDANLSGSYRVLGTTIYSIYDGVVEGMNEKGLALAEATNAYPSEYNQFEPNYPGVPAVQFGRIMRIALETCVTVDQVIALYDSTRVWFPTNVTHVLVADAGGRAAVLEFDPARRLRVFTRETPYLVMTNVAYHEGDDSMRQLCVRYSRASDLCAAGIQDRQAFAAVADSIRVTQGESRTLWTSYFDLEARSMEIRLRTDAFGAAYAYALQ